MRRVLSLWRNLLRRARVERDLDDELHATVELLVAEKVLAGMTPDEARRAACLELGSVDAIKDDVRDARAGALVERLGRDLRYALRALAKSPAVSLIMVITGAQCAIGASSSPWSVARSP